MASRNYDIAISSKSFVDTGVMLNHPERPINNGGTVLVDFRGDKRIDAIENAVRTKFSAEDLKNPQKEKEICKTIAEVMHRKEMYGPYNENSKHLQEGLAKTLSDIKDLADHEGGGGGGGNKLAALQKQAEQQKQQLDKDTGNRNTPNLKDVKSGETVCFHEAAIMSHVMGKLGIENDFCMGAVMGNVSIGHHAYVQSRQGHHNIIDATQDDVYFHNTNHANIRDGEVVTLSSIQPGEDKSHLEGTFGSGKLPNWFERHFPGKYLRQELVNTRSAGKKILSPQDALGIVITANTNEAKEQKHIEVVSPNAKPEFINLLESMNTDAFGHDVVTASELHKAFEKLGAKEKEILGNGGIFNDSDSNTNYDLSDVHANIRKEQHAKTNGQDAVASKQGSHHR